VTTVALPSGRVVTLAGAKPPAPLARRALAPLFSELEDALGKEIDVGSLELRDFHTLRAIATRLGYVAEETITLDCRNCGEAFEHAPCAAVPLGPFVDRELDDPELDATLDLSAAHRVPGLGAVRLRARTAAEAAPLFVALARRRLRIDARVVTAMGVAALGDETRPPRIARALERCPDGAFRALGDLYLRAHYPPRLFSIATCPACGARNDVDAPFEREFEPDSPVTSNADPAKDPLPAFDEFALAAREMAEHALGEHARDVAFVVEGGVPACDDGGEPLLGSYLPAAEGTATSPSRSAEIAVFFRTFRAMWAEDGPYDWRAELRETIDHELEHHMGALGGHDPMDEEERRAIDDEARRVVGKKALAREAVSSLARLAGHDLAGFLRRTWLVWAVLAIATVLAILAASRGAD
jgi:hypothetical protein